MWAGLNGIDPRNDLVLGGVRIDMGCMNLVVVISRYTRLPGTVTLISVSHNLKFTGSLHADTYTSIKRQFVDFLSTKNRATYTALFAIRINFDSSLLRSYTPLYF